MARRNVTKATIKRLFEAKANSRNYSSMKEIATNLLRFAARMAGFLPDEVDDVFSEPGLLLDNIHKMPNSAEGVQIRGTFFDERATYRSLASCSAFHFSDTHGLRVISYADFNGIVRDLLGGKLSLAFEG